MFGRVRNCDFLLMQWGRSDLEGSATDQTMIIIAYLSAFPHQETPLIDSERQIFEFSLQGDNHYPFDVLPQFETQWRWHVGIAATFGQHSIPITSEINRWNSLLFKTYVTVRWANCLRRLLSHRCCHCHSAHRMDSQSGIERSASSVAPGKSPSKLLAFGFLFHAIATLLSHAFAFSLFILKNEKVKKNNK